MKNLIIFMAVSMMISLSAKDVYLRPSVVSGDTIQGKGQTYRLWGIQTPRGDWNKISAAVLAQLTKGKEFKLLVNPKYPKVAKFGIFDRNGAHQVNASLVLLKMGLATFRSGDLPADEKAEKLFKEAEAAAKKAKVGIWAK